MTDLQSSKREAIRRYYDENTALFMRHRREQETFSIHRALWFQVNTEPARALNASNEMISGELQALRGARLEMHNPRVLDLGCGVGGTLFYLLTGDPQLRGIGVTLSRVQAQLAAGRAAQLGLDGRALIVQGDFQAVPAAQSFEFVYSIEAFAHATMPAAYLAQVARVLKPRGRLVLCDDFRAGRARSSNSERAWIDAYQAGWHVPHLQTAAQVQDLASRAGFQLLTDRALTAHLKLRALPDRVARTVRAIGMRLPFRHPIVPSMLGSMALQQCLRLGLIEYRWLVFEKS